MPKIIFTFGLPASGKTTWAKEQVQKDPNLYRINKDDMRAMFHNSVWSKSKEKFILEMRDKAIMEALERGHSVIVDDTNLHSKHLERFKIIASRFNGKVTIEQKDFTDIPIEKCIRRDLIRPNSVGEKVIRDMYKRYLTSKIEIPIIEYNHRLSDCIIIDLDGTLCLNEGLRDPYDSEKYRNDAVNPAVLHVIETYSNTVCYDYDIILLSGREGTVEGKTNTIEWLFNHDVDYTNLFMREKGDFRKDSIVKKELYEKYIQDKLNCLFVIDDRKTVCQMWRSIGLTVFQVAEGDF